jgi:UDP-2-acetamido-3-amino-2,3-dideoxy-glucuronate N-acetyltransferase
MIHPQAVVSASEIGEDTTVWQFASVIRGAVVGRGCTVAAYALIDAARVGDHCLISSQAQLHPGVEVGSRVFVGPGVIFCNDRWPTVDKEGFDGEALLGGEFKTTIVGSGASLGAGAIVLPGSYVGAGAMVAAGATVDGGVPERHLLKRSGEIVRIDTDRAPLRMRRAVWC